MKNFTEKLNEINLIYEENEDINIYLMEFISKNIKEWNNTLKILCKINNQSYYRNIKEILEKSGFTNLTEDKIRLYIRRIK